MTFRSILVVCLLLTPALALAVPRGTVVDHVRGDKSDGDWPVEAYLVVAAPPDWVKDPGVYDTQLMVEAEPTGPVTVTSARYQAPTTAALDYSAAGDLRAYPAVFAAQLKLPPRREIPKTFKVTLKLGDRKHVTIAPSFSKHLPSNAHDPQPSAEKFAYLHYYDKRDTAPILPLTVYKASYMHGDRGPRAYFSWLAPLPKGFSADAGPVTANVNGGEVDGLRIELPPPGAPLAARVLGRLGTTGYLALELVQGGRTLVQLSALTFNDKRVHMGGPRLKDLWEQASSGISGATTTGEAPKVLTFRQGNAGYFWVQYPGPEVDSTAYTAVARTSGTPVTLLTATIEALNNRSVVHVVGRFSGGGAAELTTQLVRIIGADEAPRALPVVKLALPTADGGDASARNAWVFHMRRTLERKRFRAPSTAFFDYAERALERRIKAKPEGEADAQVQPAARPVPDLLSAGTGLLAIQEALQLDAMSASSLSSGTATVPVSQLTPPGIASHPFAQMSKGRRSQGFEMDALAPADLLYAHAASFAQALALTDDLESWGLDLAHIVEGRSIDSHVRERYTDALLVETSTLTRLFGDKIVADCGVVLSDPFLREGTDLALILNLKDRALAEAALGARRKLAEVAGAATATAKHHGTDLRSWTTKDGAVSLHEADAGPYRILATSRALLTRILDAHAQRAPSLATSDDYRYMRTVFPGDHADEDAFVYLSDAFVRRMVSPAVKLAVRRRLLCAGQLTLVHNARLFARIEGRPDDLAALVKVGDLPANPRCPEGDALTVADGTPACPRHGRLDRLAALAPERVTHATPDEAAAYKAFVEGYNKYWRTYFDPVGIRVHQGPPARFETVILPLVENTIYSGLKSVLPPDPVPLAFHGATKSTVLGLAFALPKALMEELVRNAYADDLTPDEDPARWLGRELAVVVHDAAPLFTLDFGRGGIVGEMLMRNRAAEFGWIFMLSSFDLPLVVSAGVSSESAAWRFIEKSLWRARNAISNNRRFFDARFDPYLIRDGVPAPVMAMPIDLFVIKLRYFVAVHHGRIWLSNQLPALSASMSAAAPNRTVSAHVAGGWLPGQGVAAGGERDLSAAERSRRACLANLTPAWVILRLLSVAPASFETEARTALSFVPVCPESGRYELEPSTDEVQCSVHGSPERPRQRLAPDPRSPGARALARLRELFVSLSFTPEGLSTRLELDQAP